MICIRIFILLAFFLGLGCREKTEQALDWRGLKNPSLMLSRLKEQTSKSNFALTTSGKEIAKLEVNLANSSKSMSDATSAADNLQLAFEGLVSEKNNHPYPGLVSKSSTCESEGVAHPLFSETSSLWIKGFRAYSNQRWILTDCRNEDAEYTAVRIVLYCKNTKRLYSIRLFTTMHVDINNLIHSFSCEPNG